MFSLFVFLANFFNDFKNKYKENVRKRRQKTEELKNKIRRENGEPEEQGNKKPKESLSEKLVSTFFYILSLVIALFETLVAFLTIAKFLLILFIGAVVVVLIFIFMALAQSLLADNADKLNHNDIEKGENACYNVISGGALQWTSAELSASGSVLNTSEKNIYKLGMLAREHLEGKYGQKLWDLQGLDISNKVALAIGVSSIEDGFSYGDVDILTQPTTRKGNPTYGMLGLAVSKKLEDYVGADVASKIKAKYSPSPSPSYQAQYAPWGIAMSISHQNNDMKANVLRQKNTELINNIASQWGIKANKAEFVAITQVFLAQTHYHGAQISEYEGYVNFFAGVFALSSPDDANRHFSNWAMVTNAGATPSYGEGGATRSLYIGGQDYAKVDNHSSPASFPKPTSSTTSHITLNGKKIDTSLWSYVYTEGSKVNSTGMNKAWELLRSFGQSAGGSGSGWGKGARVLNFHYGINSFLQGKRAESEIAAKMKVSGETKSTIECKDDGGKEDNKTPVTPGKFKATPGQGQATINGKSTKEYMEAYYKTASSSKVAYLKGLEKFWGTSAYLEDADNPAKKAGYVDSVHGVPFYAQYKASKEDWGTYPYVPGGNTFYISACMIYSYAYSASAMLGVMINPAEMGSLLHANNAFSGNLIYTGKVPGVMNQLGLQAKDVATGKSWSGFDETLDKGGVVVIRTIPGPEKFTDSEHFQVITGKTKKDGKVYYSMYTSSYHAQSMTLYTKEQILRNMHRNALLVWK